MEAAELHQVKIALIKFSQKGLVKELRLAAEVKVGFGFAKWLLLKRLVYGVLVLSYRIMFLLWLMGKCLYCFQLIVITE